MRKLIIGIGILAILSLSSCEPPPDQDVIKFTAGNQSIELRLGFLDTESIPMVEILGTAPMAFAANEATDFSPPAEYCFIDWGTSGTGSFTGTIYYYDSSGAILDGDITIDITT